MQSMKMLLVWVLPMLLVLAPGIPSALAAPRFPTTIALPNGFQPEGIATGRGPVIYAGSLATGAIYQANLRTGQGSLLVSPQEGRIAVGLAFDSRTNYLFVAGGATGQAYVYDTSTGETVVVLQLSTMDARFINDVIVTRTAAYFTDSSRPVLYRVPLNPGGHLSSPATSEELELSGDFEFVPNAFNANGIVATRNGKSLIVVNSTLGTLYRVDPQTGTASEIDLGNDDVRNGDGLLLHGKKLYVVQNRLNQIAVVHLSPDLARGEVVRVITDSRFDVPTTLAKYASRLYAVNARFTTPPTADTTYTIVQVSKGARRP